MAWNIWEMIEIFLSIFIRKPGNNAHRNLSENKSTLGGFPWITELLQTLNGHKVIERDVKKR
jgi:hypothetical protein